MVAGSSSNLYVISSLAVEAIAMREAIFLAVNLGLPSVFFESDCLVLVEVCKGERLRNEISNIIQDILDLRSEFTFIEFAWVTRSSNGVADLIAKLKSSNSLPNNWVVSPLRALAVLIRVEAP